MSDDMKKSFSKKFIRVFRTLLPSPFAIAIVLTLVTAALALGFGVFDDGTTAGGKLCQLANWWEEGMWNNGLMVFALQAMIMLILGHVLALTKPVAWLIDSVTKRFCNSTATAAYTVTLLTVLAGLFNWGVGLIFGAIFARKVAEYAVKKGVKLNYPVIGAAGYSGLMVWHGGLSGSSLFKIADPGHLAEIMKGQMTQEQLNALPEVITYTETVFSGMNMTTSLLLVLILPFAMYWIGKRAKSEELQLPPSNFSTQVEKGEAIGAEKLDHSLLMGVGFGILVLLVSILSASQNPRVAELGFFQPNWINLTLFGLCLVLHGKFVFFLRAIDDAISGAAGILIQFPLYFGIMGLMKSSGLVHMMSEFFVELSRSTNDPVTSYPIFTFISAGIVNVFVPSGGGQWAVQGPIIVQAAQELQVSLTKSILAMAYGDQLTNMLQPFWALPLLGITGLKAKDILPHTLALLGVGMIIFISMLLIF